MMETMHEIISRVWGFELWKFLPIDTKINLRYNYMRTIANRRKRHGIIDAEQQAKKDK